MSAMLGNFFKTYTTPRLLRAENARLQLCYLMQLGVIVILFALYTIVYHQSHQQRCPVRAVSSIQTFGGFYMPDEAFGLTEKFPTVFKKFWSASDIIDRSSDGFTVLSNIIITPNQTQKTCPESPNMPNSICTDKLKETNSGNFSFAECRKGATSTSGRQTGECVYNTMETLKFYDIEWGQPGTMTCEVEGWCPLLPFSSSNTLHYTIQNYSSGAVLEFSKNLIILLNTAADFPLCGDQYIGVQEAQEGKPDCTYHPTNNPSCPWFTINDLVLYAGFISYTNVASTGQIFRITADWNNCNFDWKETCVPRYSIAPVFGRHQHESFYSEEPIYHNQEGTRTLVRRFRLKFIVEHQGEGRKTTLWLLMKTFSLGFPYLFIPGFVIQLLYNKCFKNIKRFKQKKYYEYTEDEDREILINIDPAVLELRSKVV